MCRIGHTATGIRTANNGLGVSRAAPFYYPNSAQVFLLGIETAKSANFWSIEEGFT
jgi:hypothetical protein